MFTVSECDLISNTLISHDSAPILGRPTLKDAERFRTGSIIHESKNTKNMASSRKDTKSKNVDNVISSEQTPIKIFTTILSNDDMENKNVSTYQCMSGINISINNCISKLNNQNIEITGLSKLNPVRIKKLPVRSRYALFYNVFTQQHVTDVTTTACHLRHRDREPSRIQVKWLTTLQKINFLF